MARSQIASEVSEDIRRQLDRFTRSRGLKKGYVLEQALATYMLAAQELPADLIVPARMVLADDSFAAIADRLEHPMAPTAAMEALMAGDHQAVDDRGLD